MVTRPWGAFGNDRAFHCEKEMLSLRRFKQAHEELWLAIYAFTLGISLPGFFI
jgi:hypothetical protein